VEKIFFSSGVLRTNVEALHSLAEQRPIGV
jgi:hypothetical protein